MIVNIQRMCISQLYRYNTNNYPRDAVGKDTYPDDYKIEANKTRLCEYVSFLDGYTALKLSKKTFGILIKYNNIGWKTGRVSVPRDSRQEHAEDLWACEKELYRSGLFDGTKWFFRFSTNSPKDGIPSYPITTPRHVLEKNCYVDEGILCSRKSRQHLVL